ncbi:MULTISPECIES: DUF982 domain-containing protein [Mesorhizobium]|jgi:hypothetical protein|uniref:Uncharacterized protein n=1 Tax=Rhizobium loti TaxID=381 RepID=A0A6M7TWT2_RHILI|nr:MULTISPECIES: DUF982 domain-containing protein [Mesorhizobium]KRB19573.1 hypothetical protein ASE05_24735 [Mesorhizobium sp. Root172]OBQ59854.1 hypothetical protein A8145_24805 [Mesorhizobium loti]QKC69415.1 DUF982 domain-containing protein [Mesorhizobium loti]QKC88714.1 DUF982 domain-containing protein [Mesorhizobium sp. NZP2234]
MHDKLFHSPVALTVGLGFKREIASLAEMHDFLTNWTTSRRGPLHRNAVEACGLALEGCITRDEARHALVEFAKATGILWPEIEPVIVARAVARGYGGYAA